ncbi:MAG: hypothetical protein ABIP17_06690 [Ilumatobacteraceae bacterium]
MSELGIVTERAESAAVILTGHATAATPTVVPRQFAAGSPLDAALTTLEHRLVAVDRTLANHLTAAAIELRTAAEEADRADR